jgi:amidase/aspartyl-tRNA(Asn)/glutamyl-tRNA(Gln) amidotransferase subunit A
MTLQEWQQLDPAAAAREVHTRLAQRLRPGQVRAAVAALASEADLTRELAAARGSGPLAGVPFFAKDLFDTAGWSTFAGSTFLPEVRPARGDSRWITELKRHGAVLAGKSQLHEFAYGITGENPHYGDCEHPHFAGRTTGGSSSGSAALVAAGVVPFALGTDTGGSVRVPAAFCGIYGFRLTPGDPWIRDAFPLSPTCDTAGWFTANAEDMRQTWRLLMAPESVAPTPRGAYLALPGLDPDVATAYVREASALAAPLPDPIANELRSTFDPAAKAYHTIVARDAWAVHQAWAERYRSRYDPVVWQRLKRVDDLSAADHEHADSTLASVRRAWTEFFADYDYLIMPATPCAAPLKADCTLALRSRLIALTAPASLGGRPVLTVPARLPSGLTTGLQIVMRDAKSPAIDWLLRNAETKA